MRPHLLLIPLLALVGLAACGGGGDGGSARTIGPATAPASAVELTRSGGCGEAYIWAATEDGTAVVAVSVEIPRWSTIDPVEIDVDLSAPAVEATLLRGDADLTRNLCVDVIDAGAEPDTTTAITTGTGELVISPIPTDVDPCGNATATLTLDGLTAEDGTPIGSVRAETDAIGCYAG
jgi:hypothetical protein